MYLCCGSEERCCGWRAWGWGGPGAAPRVVDVLLCEILGMPAAVTWSPGLCGAAPSGSAGGGKRKGGQAQLLALRLP